MSTPPLRNLIFRTMMRRGHHLTVDRHHRQILQELRRRYMIRDAFLRTPLPIPVVPEPTNPTRIITVTCEGDLGSCAICQEEIQPGELVTRLCCSEKVEHHHIFHNSCILEWFMREKTCPTCRHQF